MTGPQSYIANMVDYCTIGNGGRDPWQGTTGHLPEENNWDCLKNKLVNSLPFPTGNTPDAFHMTSTAAGDWPFREPWITITEEIY